ncbi:COQ9 family protein [Nitrospirillum pindoramense]|uniref:Ubiquinone biosynthesis protein COQ9 n=1 Tax=Nitrospirillum amazonense TaxID=28077 RepID=A0A560HF62_9PROT|nr:COQ9 family protein [Nitrospirillum amazonense]TWB45065.1 ubiquinone biosynthesis protein COQ9 [Nitrospirillum amazonense]
MVASDTDTPTDSTVAPPSSPSPTTPVDERLALRDRLMLAILPHVAFDGWSAVALRQGAADAGMGAAQLAALFPGGVADGVAQFSDWADRAMLAQLAGRDLSVMKVRTRVALAVRLRLELLSPWAEAVRRTSSFVALPTHTALAARLLYRTVDAIWYAAGDQSTDFNYYTKRALLAGVQTATVLYWLGDRSPDYADTWAFLDRRIENVMAFGRTLATLSPPKLSSLKNVGDLLPSPLRFSRHLRQRA